MRTKKLIVIVSFCILLSGCNKANQTNSSNSITPTISPTPTTIPVPDTYKVPDYSGHIAPDESSFGTKLADLSLLGKGQPVIACTEPVADWSRISLELQGLKSKDAFFGYNVWSSDISKEDLSVVENFNDLTFDTDTKWPEKLPEGFDPNQILEFNKNPGLGIRALHDQGITGKGVSIAIIDQGLLLDHEQYKDNLMLYEKIHCIDNQAAMHGPAVASIAVGKDIGVAPGAKLYFIASTFGHYDTSNNTNEFDASIMADSILRVLELNKYLAGSDKIRVISISHGYDPTVKGYEELTNAIKMADEQNVFVITVSTNEYYINFNLFAMERDYTANPDDFSSYQPFSQFASNFYSNPNAFKSLNQILAPIGSRTIAGCTGTHDYSISRNGGLSWGPPWCAGLYALCCQVKPDLTPQEFIDVVTSTAVTSEITHNNRTYKLGKMVNPAAVIEKLRK